MAAPKISTPAAPASRTPARRRRWPWVVGCFALLLWFLPAIVASTPLRSVILRKALGPLADSVQVGSVSLGWFSSVAVSDVVLRDPEGNVVLSVARLTASRTLLGYITNQSDLGTLRAEGAVLKLVAAGNSTNLEKALAPWLADPNPSPSNNPVPALTFELAQANLDITDADTGKQWQLQPVDLTLDLHRGAALKIQAKATLGSGGAALVDLALNEECLGEGSVHLEQMPLELFNVLVRRWDPSTSMAGMVSGQAKLRWEAGAIEPRLQVTADLQGQNCQLHTAGLGAETLKLVGFNLPWEGALEGTRLSLKRSELTSDIGKVSFRGAVDLADLAGVLSQPEQELNLDVDLARVAQLLPRALNLHHDLRVDSGRLTLKATSKADAQGTLWEAQLNTTELKGRRGAQEVRWPSPVAATVRGRYRAQNLPDLEHLTCDAGFFKLQGKGAPQRWDLTAEADLERLGAQLGRFVNLQAVRLGGQATLALAVQQEKDGGFQVEGVAQAKKWRLEIPGLRPWTEEQAQVHIKGRGKTDQVATRLDAGLIQFTSGLDRCDVTLVEPIVNLAQGPWGALQARLEGDLGRWQARLQPWTTALDAVVLQGQATLQTRLKPSTQALEFTGVKLAAQDFRCSGPGWRLHEPTLDLAGSGQWRSSRGEFSLKDTQVRSTTATLHVQRLQTETGGSGVRLSGKLTGDGDLMRLRAMFTPPGQLAGPPLVGKVWSDVEFLSVGGRCTLEGQAIVHQLVLGPPAQPTWKEPYAKLQGKVLVDGPQDLLHLTQLRVENEFMTCDAQGKLAHLGSSCDLDVQGQLGYDLEKLEPYLKPYLGSGVKAQGKDRRPFHVVGPLRPAPGAVGPKVTVGAPPASGSLALAKLQGDAGFHWNKLTAYGADIGQAEVKAQFQNGWLKLLPLEGTINSGRLRLTGDLRLDPGPAELILPAGTVVDKARITPSLCASAVGYALPMIANVAEAEGLITLILDNGRMPLADPSRTQLQGKLLLHNARIGPSPMIKELSVLLKSPPLYSQVKESPIPIHMADGKIHHQDLEMIFPEITMRTSGWVSVDGKLSLVAEMPVPPRWIGADRLGNALSKQIIRLPIGGTLDRPRLDEPALRAAIAQFTRDAAGAAIRNELENQLKGLFRPK